METGRIFETHEGYQVQAVIQEVLDLCLEDPIGPCLDAKFFSNVGCINFFPLAPPSLSILLDDEQWGIHKQEISGFEDADLVMLRAPTRLKDLKFTRFEVTIDFVFQEEWLCHVLNRMYGVCGIASTGAVVSSSIPRKNFRYKYGADLMLPRDSPLFVSGVLGFFQVKGTSATWPSVLCRYISSNKVVKWVY